jgi:hypothetical protein
MRTDQAYKAVVEDQSELYDAASSINVIAERLRVMIEDYVVTDELPQRDADGLLVGIHGICQ